MSIRLSAAETIDLRYLFIHISFFVFFINLSLIHI